LIEKEPKWLERLRLRSRKGCFDPRGRWSDRLLNVDFYFFAANFLWRLSEILETEKPHAIDLERHQRHYLMVRDQARLFRDEFCQMRPKRAFG
jgi:hypothetical protein